MTDEHAKQEGYVNMEEYKQSILAMHAKMPWLPTMRGVHEFSRSRIDYLRKLIFMERLSPPSMSSVQYFQYRSYLSYCRLLERCER